MLTRTRSDGFGVVTGGMAGLLSLMCVAPAHAANHLWILSELFSDSTGDVQFIEMHNDFQSEGFTAGTMLTATNSDGTDSHQFTFPSNLPDTVNTADRFLLIATADFETLPGSVTPDFTLPEDFLFIDGGTLTYSASGDTVTYDLLPTDGVMSLSHDLSTHALGPAVNSPTNFAGDVGSIVVPEPASLAVAAFGTGLLLLRRSRYRSRHTG